jgi:hypothetical protein
MKRAMTLGLLVAVGAIAGCDHSQTLRFDEGQALMPALRVETDFRYNAGSGWSLPTAPGTPEAEIRDEGAPDDGGGIAFRLYGDWSHRQVRDIDEVRSGETAVVDQVAFGPGFVEGAFKINREDLGFKFLFFTRRYYFTGGIGVFWTHLAIDGSVHTTDAPTPVHASVSSRNWGPGFVMFAEVCPGIPELRIYGQITTWNAFDGKGFMVGTDREVGVKGRFRGISIFGGWRWEEIGGRLEQYTGESKLAFTISGPVFGVGVTF